MRKSFYIASGKGGTGKSVVAVNLSAALALMGYNTLLIDMDPGMRNLDLLLETECQSVYHVFDVMNGICPLEQAIVRMEEPEKLMLLPGGLLEDRDNLELEKWRELIRACKESYDFVIVDGASGADDFVLTCSQGTDETIIVVTPETTSLRNADMLEDRLIRGRVLKRRLLINRIRPELEKEGLEPSPKEIDRRFKCELLGMILDDDNFRLFSDAGIPIATRSDSYISRNFRRIAERLVLSE